MENDDEGINEETGHHQSRMGAFVFTCSDYSQFSWWAMSPGVARVVTQGLIYKHDSIAMRWLAKFYETSWLRHFVFWPAMAHGTIIDFHVLPHGPGGHMPPHPTQKFKWAERAWTMPEDMQLFVTHFNTYVARYHPSKDLGIRDICDFYDPQMRWPDDDISYSPRKYEIMETCASALEAEGFYNLKHCKGYASEIFSKEAQPADYQSSLSWQVEGATYDVNSGAWSAIAGPLRNIVSRLPSPSLTKVSNEELTSVEA